MAGRQTEALHELAIGLDRRPLAEIASVLAEAQIQATFSLRAALDPIAAGAAAMAATIRNGGVLHYAAAGSSGLMAAADAQELGGTFSIPVEQILIHMAGGLPIDAAMPGGTEDDTAGLDRELANLTARDALIAVSASGTTPYTLAAARIARKVGATVIGIANNRGAPLLELADHKICLETPPEVLSGSTRLGAGTAQKIALNMLSTLMAVELGHVYDGMMVNMRAENIKLHDRSIAIIRRITGADQDTAAAAVKAAEGAVKPAVLIAAKGITAQEANTLLRTTEGNLRAALA